MKNMKRIHKVTIKRMVDDSPDTSWLGEYSNSSESEYAIDRKHDLYCPINNPPKDAIAQAERISKYLDKRYDEILDVSADFCDKNATELSYLQDARDILENTIRELEECNCDERGDMQRHEYRYFNGVIENYAGETPENIRKYVTQDYKRMEDLNNGQWCFIGIRAGAEYTVQQHGVIQTMTSGGLWGIESDSDESFFKEIEQEQLSELKEQLHAIGFSYRAIASAFKNAEHKDN
jgi:hypothetical protein